MKSILKILISSLFLLAGLASAQSSPQNAVLYENVRVFDGVSEKLTPPTNVLVVNNLIKTISSKPIEIPQGTTATVIAGGGRTLMPGLSDAHTHLWLTATMDEILQGDVKKLNAIAYKTAKEMLFNGWTTVRDEMALRCSLDTKSGILFVKWNQDG